MNSVILTIYIDGWCLNCKRFSRIIKHLDIFDQLNVLNIRVDTHIKIEADKALKAIAAIDKDERIYYGFKTIYKITTTLPLLWVFLPIMYILSISKLGDVLYHELAIRRKIIPLHCDENECFS